MMGKYVRRRKSFVLRSRSRSTSDTWRKLVREQHLDDEQTLKVTLRLARDCERQ
jgi:hypothetical protein